MAAHVLAIVERELMLGDETAAPHRERLGRLGFGSDAELAAAIRSGGFADRHEELARELGEMVDDKPAVGRPGYGTGGQRRLRPAAGSSV